MHRLIQFALLLTLSLVTGARPSAPQDKRPARPTLPRVAADQHRLRLRGHAPGAGGADPDHPGQQRPGLHHAQLATLAKGRTIKARAALQQGEAALFAMLTFVGGPGIIPPGGQSQVILDLQPGQ